MKTCKPFGIPCFLSSQRFLNLFLIVSSIFWWLGFNELLWSFNKLFIQITFNKLSISCCILMIIKVKILINYRGKGLFQKPSTKFPLPLKRAKLKIFCQHNIILYIMSTQRWKLWKNHCIQLTHINIWEYRDGWKVCNVINRGFRQL